MLRYRKQNTYSLPWLVISKRCISRVYTSQISAEEKLTIGKSEINTTHFPFNRFLRVYEMLSDNSMKFTFSVLNCLNTYNSVNSSFMEDLFKYSYANRHLFDFISRHFWKSSSIRGLVLHDLLKMFENQNYQRASQILEKLLKHYNMDSLNIDMSQNEDTFRKNAKRNEVGRQLITFASKSGENLIASHILFKLYDTGLKYNDKLVRLVIDCLIKSNQYREYSNFVMMKLVAIFPQHKYTSKEIGDILSFVLKNANGCYFANCIFQRLLSRIEIYNDDVYLSECLNRLIWANIESVQYKRAVEIYVKLKKFTLVQHNIDIQVILAAHLKEVRQYLKDYSNTKIADFLLQFHSKNEDKLRVILKKLVKPIQRLTLSSLFYTFLVRGSIQEADIILQSINKSNSGVQHRDLELVVNGYLKKADVISAISLATKNNILVSKVAYVSILKFLLEEKLVFQYTNFLENMSREFQKIRNDEVLLQLIPIFVKWFSDNHHYLVGKAFLMSFMNAQLQFVGVKHPEVYDLRLNMVLDILNLSLPINQKNFIESVHIIMSNAIKNRDLQTICWCIKELRKTGILLQEILGIIREVDEEFFILIFDENIQKLL